MPGYLIQQGATVLCAHGGNATAAAANSRVTVNGTPTLVLAEPWQVAGCAATPSCVTSEWVTGATRVTSGGQPVVIGSGEALSAPSGAPLVPYVVQSRVTAELGAAPVDLAFPYGFDGTGRTARAADLGAHLAGLIEQILFTAPGERVNRPTFGSGTEQLVFEPNSDVLAAAQQQAIQASLQQWLSDLIRVQSVTVTADEATLAVAVTYQVVSSQQQLTQQFVYGTGGSAS